MVATPRVVGAELSMVSDIPPKSKTQVPAVVLLAGCRRVHVCVLLCESVRVFWGGRLGYKVGVSFSHVGAAQQSPGFPYELAPDPKGT